MHNFKKLMDTPECDILFEHYPDAFILMTIIAKKARQNDSLALMGLSKGQTFIGDYKKFGLTESRYRKAKMQLAKFGLASFRPTNRGTIATINDTRIYDVNKEQDNEQIAVKQQPEIMPEQTIEPTPGTDSEDVVNDNKRKDSAPDLNKMLKEKVIEPLRRDINPAFWEKFISPLVIKSIDESKNIAYLYHSKDNSWVNNHFRDKIEEKLGMDVQFVNEA